MGSESNCPCVSEIPTAQEMVPTPAERAQEEEKELLELAGSVNGLNTKKAKADAGIQKYNSLGRKYWNRRRY